MISKSLMILKKSSPIIPKKSKFTLSRRVQFSEDHHSLEYTHIEAEEKTSELSKIPFREIRNFIRMFSEYPEITANLTRHFLKLSQIHAQYEHLEKQEEGLVAIVSQNNNTLATIEQMHATEQSELANVKVRGENAVEKARSFSISKISKEAIDVLDNFDRSIEGLTKFYSKETGFDALIERNRLIKLFLESELKKLGIHKMNTAVGDTLDPNLHTAIALLPIPNMNDNQIVDIGQCGYMIGNRLLRDAKVVVVKNS